MPFFKQSRTALQASVPVRDPANLTGWCNVAFPREPGAEHCPPLCSAGFEGLIQHLSQSVSQMVKGKLVNTQS